MTSQKIRQYLTLTCKTAIPKLLFILKSKFGDDRALFNVIFDVCYV